MFLPANESISPILLNQELSTKKGNEVIANNSEINSKNRLIYAEIRRNLVIEAIAQNITNEQILQEENFNNTMREPVVVVSITIIKNKILSFYFSFWIFFLQDVV